MSILGKILCVHTATMMHRCQRTTWQEWVLSFYQMGSGNQFQDWQQAGRFMGFTTLMKVAINCLLLTLEIQRLEYTKVEARRSNIPWERTQGAYATNWGLCEAGAPNGVWLAMLQPPGPVGSRQLMPKDCLSWKWVTSLAESLRNCLGYSPKEISQNACEKINTTSKLVFSNYIFRNGMSAIKATQGCFWCKHTKELAEGHPTLLHAGWEGRYAGYLEEKDYKFVFHELNRMQLYPSNSSEKLHDSHKWHPQASVQCLQTQKGPLNGMSLPAPCRGRGHA